MRSAGFVAAAAGLSAAVALAVEPPVPPAERERMLAGFNRELATLDRAIIASPRDVPLYSRRGDMQLFLARFPAAVADFERMITLDPAQDAPHWRLGIAYHFTGQFEKSARQFEKYHAHDNRDRENGIWKFLADAKTLGLVPARRAMLVYTRFDREPFPALYEMFAGITTTRDFLASVASRGLADDPGVMFFAHYYAGLNEHILGRPGEALPLLRAAVARPDVGGAGNEPSYMWQVARLHYETLSAANVR